MKVDSIGAGIASSIGEREVSSAVPEARSRVGEFCDRLMVWSLLAITVLAPAVFSLLNADIFDLPKVVLTRLFTIIVLAAWCFKVLFAGEFRLVRTKIDLPLLAYLSLVTFTTLISASPFSSLFGEHNRDDGALALINYGLVFWMAVNVYKEREQIWHAVRWQVVVGACIAAYGVAQMFNIGTFGNFWELWPGGRAAATLGHPSFLSTYLGMVIPLGLMLISRPRSSRERNFWIGLTLVIFAGLVLSYGRSGWLGAAAAFLFLSLTLGWYKQLRERSVLFASGAVVAVLMTYFFIIPTAFPNVPKLPGQFSVKDRVQQMIFEPGNDVRIFYWQGAVQVIRENWLLGVGVNNFQGAFMKFSSVEYAKGEGFRAAPDKAHSEYLHIAAVSGVPALGFYLWFMGGFVWLAIKKRHILREDPLATALVGAFIANFVAVAFLFNSVGEAPVFWWAIGAAVVLIGRDGKFSWTLSNRFVPHPMFANVAGIVVVVSAILLSYNWAVRPWLADYLVREADMVLQRSSEKAPVLESYSEGQLANVPSGHGGSHSSNSLVKATGLYKEAVTLWPYQYVYWDRYAAALQIAGATAFSKVDSNRLLDEAVFAASESIRLNPTFPSAYVRRGEIYTAYGEEHANDALKDFRTAVVLGPFYYDAQVFMAQFAFSHGLRDEGMAASRRIVEIKPDNWEAWYNLGLAYQESGRFAAAEQALLTILKANPEDLPARQALASTYFKMGKYDESEAELKRILELEPENKGARENLSMVNQWQSHR